MRKLFLSRATRTAVVLAGLVVVSSVPLALGADSSGLRSRAGALRSESAALATQRNAAVQTLYALETDLTRALAAVAAAGARRDALAAQRASTRRQLETARASLRASQRNLARLIRTLYEQNGLDPLAIVLGAESLDSALAGLDDLDRAAGQSSAVLAQARVARRRLARIDARLAARSAELARVAEAAGAQARALEAKAEERAAYVAELSRREGLNAQRVAALESEAKAAARQTSALATAPAQALVVAAAPVAPAPVAAAPPAPGGERTMTVSAVGYSLPGRTASGLPVGHGIIAVDPGVIPLGTRVYVPGYGEAVAADTGGAVRGAMIDLWFPTTAAALQWGRRTVVITIH